MARHHLDVNTSVRPNTHELDGCGAELLSHPVANDRDAVDDGRISGEREVVATTRPPPPDVDADGVVALHLDAIDEVTRPLPRSFPSPASWSARTALRLDRRLTVPSAPAAPPALRETPPRSRATPRPPNERRRRVGDRGAIAWSSTRDTASSRPEPGAVPRRETFVPWVAAIIGGLVLFAAQEVLTHVVTGP